MLRRPKARLQRKGWLTKVKAGQCWPLTVRCPLVDVVEDLLLQLRGRVTCDRPHHEWSTAVQGSDEAILKASAQLEPVEVGGERKPHHWSAVDNLSQKLRLVDRITGVAGHCVHGTSLRLIFEGLKSTRLDELYFWKRSKKARPWKGCCTCAPDTVTWNRTGRSSAISTPSSPLHCRFCGTASRLSRP